jgi:imidazolonepropionase-like amidohydrolase
VKLMASGGVADAHENPEASQFTPSELAAAVDEAHRAGVHVAAHAHPASAIRDCLLAGVDTIEHATYLSDEVIDLLLTRDAAIVPTFAVYHRIAANERLSPAQRELSQRLWDVKAERFATAVRAGVRWGIGTDAGSYQPPGLVADEIRHVIAAGVTPREALLAATAVNAEIVRASNTGRIAEGCSADLVFLDGDPLLDTAVLDRPTAVFVNGSLAHGQAIAA